MNTVQAQEMLDRNSETIKEIMLLQEQMAKQPAGISNAAERKEKLQAKLHKRLLKLTRFVTFFN
jgi:hypothetical protein